MATFSTSVTRDGDTTILSLSGDLDIATVDELRHVGYEELDRQECRRLVLELAGLTFLDSTGIGCWVELHTHARAHDQQVTIRSVPHSVRRILEIGGLINLFAPDSI